MARKAAVLKRPPPGPRQPPYWIVVAVSPEEADVLAAGPKGDGSGGGRQVLSHRLADLGIRDGCIELPRDVAEQLVRFVARPRHGGLGPVYRRIAAEAETILAAHPDPALF